ncbi:fungal-specific transcription factor domain-containing protein [Aspergillus heterothallicus]
MSKLVPIAPAPANASELGASRVVQGHVSMQYTCQTCIKRKVKCDRVAPVCSRCRKANVACYYVQPRSRGKRKLSEGTSDLHEKLARYEGILRGNGLIDDDEGCGADFAVLPQLSRVESVRPITGALVGEKDASQYVDSHLWRSLGDDEMQRMPDDAENAGSQVERSRKSDFAVKDLPDPFTDAFLDYDLCGKDPLQYQSTHEQGLILWETYLDNVEPLCKILHLPSATKIVEQAWEQPEQIPTANECLLSCIYHFAVFSMTEEDCLTKLGQPRDALLQRYHSAARRAFVNASFLKTTSITVLQALVLFLMPCRHIYDSQTYWILTGVAVRIGQRLGIHRDGERLGLPPFQTEMRRRLFYHLLPLDSSASQISGVGASLLQSTWDTQLPLNLSDDQIWPEMTSLPEGHNGATEMMFCLSRFCVGRHLSRLGGPADLESSSHFRTLTQAELSVSKAEAEVEEKYIRYCDILNPMHFLTMSLARAGILAMRLKIRLPKVRNKTASDDQIREAIGIAGKILDTDTAIHAQETIMKKFRWHIRSFFVWGSWDSFILILTTLWKRPGLLSPVERGAAWDRLERLYGNHDELLQSTSALNAGFRRLTLKAWGAQPPDTITSVPEFIVALHKGELISPRGVQVDRMQPSERDDTETPKTDGDASLGVLPGDIASGQWDGFSLDGVDWGLWDQFIQEDPGL